MAVDLLGGDQAPAVVVDGALRAAQADPALQLLLVGPPEAAELVLAALPPEQHARVRVQPVAPAPDDLDGHAAGRSAHAPAVGRARQFAEPGVRAAVNAVAAGLADAVVSAGDTGAVVTSAAITLGRLIGVRRPPLAAVLPSAAGRIVLLDVGSSVDPDEHTLATHARLGAAYAQAVHGIAAPRVGLLTIGTEPGKGDRLRRAAPELFEEIELPAGARYTGLVEGNDVVTGAVADVVVTDGFAGNVLLKGLETAYATLGPPPSDPPRKPPPRAAVLLGVGGLVVVCHGAASGRDMAAGIALAATLHRIGTVEKVASLVREEASEAPAKAASPDDADRKPGKTPGDMPGETPGETAGDTTGGAKDIETVDRTEGEAQVQEVVHEQ
ncbi:phosphate acyltransferase PlsX [Symbioplanes lichenis]|uniref:phosphate acyltransferase PlsX n=1 Tax=Symbioplanes lichenis TaxID=1629072 RepID=UPI002739F444|nr:phosphate acyltransferase PlsX [Actinoplanes lichenis]